MKFKKGDKLSHVRSSEIKCTVLKYIDEHWFRDDEGYTWNENNWMLDHAPVLYYVRLPIVRLNTLGTAVEKDYKYLGVDPETGESNIFQGLTLPDTLIKSGWETKLTEQEIKAIDERFLTFAIPVKEVEEGK